MAVRFVHALVVCLGILFGYPDEFGLGRPVFVGWPHGVV